MAKDTIILLHGWGGSRDSLEPLRTELSKHFQAISFNLPGFGKEAEPRGIWGVKDYAKFVVEKAQKMGVNKFHLFGHSFGGQIAVQIALDFPQKVQNLILCGSAIVRQRSTKTKLLIKASKLVKAFGLSPILKLLMRHSDYQQASPKMKKVMNKILQEDLTESLNKLHSPTLILWGEKDSYTPLWQAYLIHQKIPNSKLKIFKDLRHNLPLVEAKLVVKEIQQWI